MPTSSRWTGSDRVFPVWLLVTAAALFLLRVALAAGLAPSVPIVAEPELVAWRSLEAGEAEASASGRPILYDVGAEWCAPCKTLDRQVFADPEVAALVNERFVPVRVVDRQREDGTNPPAVERLYESHGVGVFPTVLIVDGGREVMRLVGYPGKREVVDRLRAAAGK